MKRSHTLLVGRYEVIGEYEATRVEHDDSWGISDAEWGRLEIAAARAVLTHAESIKGGELKFARKAMGLRQPDLAALLDVGRDTRRPSPPASRTPASNHSPICSWVVIRAAAYPAFSRQQDSVLLDSVTAWPANQMWWARVPHQ